MNKKNNNSDKKEIITDKSFLQKMRVRIDQWASDDFFVPTFVCGAGSSEEILSHLSSESGNEDVFLADRDSTSLKPDLLIISGIINYKNLNNILREYSNLVGRKYVVVIGRYNKNTKQVNQYNIVENVEDYIPVDLFIHGNPPSREEIISGLNQLKEIRK